MFKGKPLAFSIDARDVAQVKSRIRELLCGRSNNTAGGEEEKLMFDCDVNRIVQSLSRKSNLRLSRPGESRMPKGK